MVHFEVQFLVEFDFWVKLLLFKEYVHFDQLQFLKEYLLFME